MKTAVLLALVMMLLASPSHAGLDLGWGNCITDGGTADVALPCAGFSGADLYGSFQVDNTVAQFIALDVVIDVQTTTDPAGDFWNFGGGECNDGNLVLDDARFGDCFSALPTMCLATGAQCSNGFAWASGFGGTNRARLVASIFRDATSPVAVNAGSNYFAFKISFFTFNAVEGGGGGCVGCSDKVVLIWNSALASGLSSTADTEIQEEPIEGTGMKSNCVGINGGVSLCSGAKTNKTWGQIKSQYR